MKQHYQSTLRKKQKKKQASRVQQEKFNLANDVFLNRKIVSPEKLKILVLSGNDLTNEELDFIQKCTSLLKLDLSNNKINKIPKKLNIRSISDLRVILLHNNRIQRIEGLQGVIQSQNLMHFTLHGNPIMSLPKIEHLVVNMITSLRIFNSRVVKIQERSFQIFAERTEKYADRDFLENWKSNSSSQAYYIKVLQLQLNYIQNIWLRHNPIILIQRVWKALVRQNINSMQQPRENQTLEISKQLLQKKNATLENVFNIWKQFYMNRKAVRKTLYHENEDKDKTYLTYKLGDYRMAKRNLRLQEYVQAVVRKIRHKIMLRRMCQKLIFNMKVLVYGFNHQEAFFNVCQINKNKRILFSKSQKHLLDNFLAHIAKNFNKRQAIHQHTKIDVVKQYLSIRMVDPQTIENKKCYNILNYLIWPSMKVIFLKKRKHEGKTRGNIIKIRPLMYMKNRDKVLTEEQYRKSCQIYNRLKRFSNSEYEQSLYYFECDDEEVMKMLIRYIFYHNRKKKQFQNILPKSKMLSLLQSYTQPFVFYNDRVLQRTAAAVRIQQNWRRYTCIKSQKQTIFTRMTINRSVLKIQRFFREASFNQRFQFQNRLNIELYKFVDPCFLLHQSIYKNIQSLSKQLQFCSLYNYLTVVRIGNKIDINWQFDNYPFSKQIVQTHFLKRNQMQQRILFDNSQAKQTDVYGALHINAATSVLDYNGDKFIRFSYPTVQQTRFRVAILALLTYKIFGKMFIIPLPTSDVDYFPEMMAKYTKYSCLRGQIRTIAKKQIHSNRLKNIKDVSQNQGIFLFTSKHKKTLPENKATGVQFYQRKYNDYPLKFSGEIYYSIKNFAKILADQKEQQQKQKKREKQEQLQAASQKIRNYSKMQLIQQIKVMAKDQKQEQKQEQQKSIKQFTLAQDKFKITIKDSEKDIKRATINEESFLNVSKVDKKRMSLYQIGGNSKAFRKQLHSQPQSPKQRQQKSVSENPYLSFFQTKRQNVQNFNKDSEYKKQAIKDRKNNQIHRIREKMKKQKQVNQTIKSMKQIERSQEMKKKIQKIREFKKRASSNKKEQQSQFLQQGNFVMEQQLKMVIMRNRFKDRQSNSKNKKNSMTLSVKQSIQHRMGKTVSIMSKNDEDANEKYKSSLIEEDVQGQEREIRNTKVSFGLAKRNRNSSIGAYIRDPAFVHGVFPQEYYPIESKGNMKIRFPPL